MRDQVDDPGPTGRNRGNPNPDLQRLNAAFARAEREQRELQRLKSSGKPYACLDFHPERLSDEEPRV